MPSATRLVPPLFVLLWATGFIGARYAMPWAEPFTFLAARFCLAFAILAVVLIFWRSRNVNLAGAMHAAIAGTLMHGIYLGGVFWAIHRGMPAGISALIVGLQPLITALLAGQLLGEKILPRHWLGLGLGFVGVVVVLAPKFARWRRRHPCDARRSRHRRRRHEPRHDPAETVRRRAPTR